MWNTLYGAWPTMLAHPGFRGLLHLPDVMILAVHLIAIYILHHVAFPFLLELVPYISCCLRLFCDLKGVDNPNLEKDHFALSNHPTIYGTVTKVQHTITIDS